MLRALTLAIAAVALSFVPAAPALADGGCGGPARPSCTIIRPSPQPERARVPAAWGQECIVTVGGLASPVDGSDQRFFSTVLGDVGESIAHRRIRFGVDLGEYDTEGAVSRSSAGLRAVIRSIADDCEAIHLLAHSMGGLVVDRALSKIDPRAHGVATYVAMASPHNGATAARVLTMLAGAYPQLAVAAELIDAPDLRSEAVQDLAAGRRPRLVPRVDEHVRVRMTTDEIVYRADNFDRRVDVREFTPDAPREWLGHGGIVHNEQVQAIVRATIATGRVPPMPRAK